MIPSLKRITNFSVQTGSKDSAFERNGNFLNLNITNENY